MSFSLNIQKVIDDLPSVKPQGLDLAEDAIDRVIATVTAQMDAIAPEVFENHGAIQAASFGGADAAPNLSMHYNRAHEVTWKTLKGLKEDLEVFRDACRNARNQIVDIDEDSAERNARTRDALDLLTVGSTNGQGDRDNRNAQQNQDTTGGSDI